VPRGGLAGARLFDQQVVVVDAHPVALHQLRGDIGQGAVLHDRRRSPGCCCQVQKSSTKRPGSSGWLATKASGLRCARLCSMPRSSCATSAGVEHTAKHHCAVACVIVNGVGRQGVAHGMQRRMMNGKQFICRPSLPERNDRQLDWAKGNITMAGVFGKDPNMKRKGSRGGAGPHHG